MTKGTKNAMGWVLIGTVAIVFLVLGISAGSLGWMEQLREGLDKNLSYGLFLILMAVLPVVGFPISAFLVLGGIRFGIGWGLLAMAITFPFHLLAVYLITHSFLRPRVKTLLNRYDYSMPTIPPHRAVLYTSLLVGIPSLPYTVKNYLLALADLSRRLYFGLVLPIHFVVGIPFVILGKSVISFNVALSLITVGIIVLGNLVINRVRNRVESTNESHKQTGRNKGGG